MPNLQTYTGGIAATNGYLYRWNDREVVVDAPEGMAAWLEEGGHTPEVLLLTHAHFDHVMDAARIQERWRCPVLAYAQPTPALTLEAALVAFEPLMTVAPYRVDQLLEGKQSLELFGGEVPLLWIPGHSADSLAFHFAEDNLIFVGDVLMQGSIGRDDLPGGDGPLLRQGIREKLYGLDEGLRVYPGHGAPTEIGVEKRSNPFVRG